MDSITGNVVYYLFTALYTTIVFIFHIPMYIYLPICIVLFWYTWKFLDWNFDKRFSYFHEENEGGYNAPIGEYYPARHVDPMYDYF